MELPNRIKIPSIVNVPLKQLKEDLDNPNEMTDEQLEALASFIEERGFLVPIITNQDYLIADGHHRYRAAKRLGMTEVPVVALEMEEVDRIVLRQVMNKLKGEHSRGADLLDMVKLEEAGKLSRLKELLPTHNLAEFVEKQKERTRLAQEMIKNPTTVKVDKVKQLGRHVITCPKCQHEFERA